jgi:hypothetical protein
MKRAKGEARYVLLEDSRAGCSSSRVVCWGPGENALMQRMSVEYDAIALDSPCFFRILPRTSYETLYAIKALGIEEEPT